MTRLELLQSTLDIIVRQGDVAIGRWFDRDTQCYCIGGAAMTVLGLPLDKMGNVDLTEQYMKLVYPPDIRSSRYNLYRANDAGFDSACEWLRAEIAEERGQCSA